MANEISDFHRFAWSENSGWLNFKSTHANATVFADHLEGYVWAENVGWIRLGTHSNGGAHTYSNDGTDTYGVNNDGFGNLSGYAWGENIGWVNFNPSHSQVTIDPMTGDFDGYAWAENIGWVHFQNTSRSYKVTQTTDVTETVPLALDLTEDAKLAEIQSTTAIVGTNNQINLSQDSATGLLSANVNNTRFKLRPVESEQLLDQFTPGITLNEDGLFDIISDHGTLVTLLAEPQQVVQLFSVLSAMGFESQQQNYGLIKIESTLNEDGSNIWYAVRPAFNSDPTGTQSVQALTSSLTNKPPNTVLYEHNFVLNGSVYRQILYPTPADWERLKGYLKSFGQVTMDSEGQITVNINNTIFKAIPDYLVSPSDNRLGQVELMAIGDKNGDQIADYKIIYPNGDTQILYLLE